MLKNGPRAAVKPSMALEEELPDDRQELRRSIDCLEGSADLKDVPVAVLQTLAAGAVHFSVPAGNVLFESGSASEGVYLLASGRLGVHVPGHAAFAAEIERGELVGEAGWLLGEPRSATVIALRDSEVLLLPGAVIDAAASLSGEFALSLARLSARRLRRSNSPSRRNAHARVFTVVPNSEEVDAIEFAARWVEELGRSGRAELVWDVRAGMHTSEWFSRLEESNDYVVYVADPGDSGWTRQCCRQADVVLALARAEADVRDWPRSVADAAARSGAHVELALLHPSTLVAGAAARWLPTLPVALHHHLVDGADLARLTRLVTGRGVGLVLSGGGAEQVFQEMAIQGQSFFNAVGDSDAFTGAIPFPSDSANITEVGGTALSTTGPGGSYVSEWSGTGVSNMVWTTVPPVPSVPGAAWARRVAAAASAPRIRSRRGNKASA